MNLRQSWTELPARNRRLALAVVLMTPMLFAVAGLAKTELLKHGALFMERREASCLPWLLYAGHYGVHNVDRGDLIAFKAQGLALFKDGDVLTKLVAGREGDVVEIRNGVVAINGQVIGDVTRGARRLHKPMTAWDTRYTIGRDEFFMLGTEYRSYDSRYWGVIKRDQFVAKLSLVG